MLHKTNKLVLVMICTLALGGPAIAAPCFTPQEAEAEAALRYEAELRITGLSCTSSVGKTLYQSYQSFTGNNKSTFETYQNSLIAYYKRGKGDPMARLHAHETEVENDIALDAAKQGPQVFCPAHIAQLQAAVLASPTEVKNQVAAYEAAHHSSTKICD